MGGGFFMRAFARVLATITKICNDNGVFTPSRFLVAVRFSSDVCIASMHFTVQPHCGLLSLSTKPQPN